MEIELVKYVYHDLSFRMAKTALEAGIVRAKNARQKRKMTHQAPKVVENTKSTIFIKGGNVSDILSNVFTDLHGLKVLRVCHRSPFSSFFHLATTQCNV